MNNLIQFLTDLAVNPQMQVVFEKDPDTVLEAVELSKKDKLALKSKGKGKINAALAGELETNELMAVMGSCALSDPGPDPDPDPDPLPGDED